MHRLTPRCWSTCSVASRLHAGTPDAVRAQALPAFKPDPLDAAAPPGALQHVVGAETGHHVNHAGSEAPTQQQFNVAVLRNSSPSRGPPQFVDPEGHPADNGRDLG